MSYLTSSNASKRTIGPSPADKDISALCTDNAELLDPSSPNFLADNFFPDDDELYAEPAYKEPRYSLMQRCSESDTTNLVAEGYLSMTLGTTLAPASYFKAPVCDESAEATKSFSQALPDPCYGGLLNPFSVPPQPAIDDFNLNPGFHALSSEVSSYSTWASAVPGLDIPSNDFTGGTNQDCGFEGSTFPTQDCGYPTDYLCSYDALPEGLEACASGNVKDDLFAEIDLGSHGFGTFDNATDRVPPLAYQPVHIRMERKISCRTYCKRLHVTQGMADKLLPLYQDPKTGKKPLTGGYELLFKLKLELIDIQGESWPVEYEGVVCCSQRHLRLTSGWRQFVQSKNIQVGDTVVFERRGHDRQHIYVDVVRAIV